MSGVALMCFTRSFFLWDNMIDRTRLHKMVPVIDVWVIPDTFMEFAFAIAVTVANMWLVFIEDDTDMLLNSMAMEFLMQMDNEYEALYFEFLPESATDIYDNVFVTHRENRKLVGETLDKSRCFRITRNLSWLPFKILMFCTAVFQLFVWPSSLLGGFVNNCINAFYYFKKMGKCLSLYERHMQIIKVSGCHLKRSSLSMWKMRMSMGVMTKPSCL